VPPSAAFAARQWMPAFAGMTTECGDMVVAIVNNPGRRGDDKISFENFVERGIQKNPAVRPDFTCFAYFC